MTTTKLTHTEGDWTLSEYRTDKDGVYKELGSFGGAEWIADVRGKLPGNAQLLALARTAPHDCSDPYCPGNVNRLKLKAYGKLQASHDRLLDELDRLAGEVQACWGMDEPQLRRELGNTNYQAVADRLVTAKAALTEAPA